MAVNVFLSTTLRECVPGYRPVDGLTIDLAGPATVRELAERIGLPLAEIKIVMINGRQSNLDAPVHDGDRVGVFPAVGGG